MRSVRLSLSFARILPLRLLSACAVSGAVALSGCTHPAAPPAAPQALPVQVQPVVLSDVPERDSYVATIKSRRSSTMQPQVDGNITRIFVRSGQTVKQGEVLMQINPLRQTAAVQQSVATADQQKSVLDYNQNEAQRQKQLFDAGVISKQQYDQAVQGLGNSRGAYDASVAQVRTQREQLAYYQIRAPFPGVVGDIPVHEGDYVSQQTLLTTVNEDRDLEAYIYLPTERTGQVRNGLPVELLDNAGKSLAVTAINFVSPQVDAGTQSILAKAPVSAAGDLRNLQIVNARITWKTNSAPTVPVLAITRIGGAAFVFVAAARGAGFYAHQVGVTVGDAIGNNYPVLSGLKSGERVIVSGLQFLQEGAPVQPLGSRP